MVTSDRKLRLADFGLSILSKDVLAQSSNLFFVPEAKVAIKGSPLYAPPEVYLKQHLFSCKSDIFACGVMLHCFLTANPEKLEGEFPFKTPQDICSKSGCTATVLPIIADYQVY